MCNTPIHNNILFNISIYKITEGFWGEYCWYITQTDGGDDLS